MISSQVQRLDYFWAALSGGLLILSFPIVNLWPLAWFFLVPLLLCIRGKKGKDAFFLGAFAGAVAYLGLIYWIVVAVHRYGHIPLPLAIPILLLLVIYLSLYWGAFTFFVSYVNSKSEWIALLTFPALWAGLEYLRSFLISGFPWVLVGYSQYLNTPFVQIADITGVYGVSYLLIMCNTLIFLWIVRWRERKWVPLKGTIFTMILLAVVCAYGFWKIYTPLTIDKKLTVGVAQGNIEQDVKWDKGFQKETLDIYRKLTAKLSKTSPQLVIWPETAVPAYFPSGTGLDKKVLSIPYQLKTYLLFGSLSSRKQDKEVKVYNSAYLISPRPRIVSRYDKMHLVPFGEYVPLSSFFPLFNSLVGIGNITSGEEAVVFQFPGGTFGTLICFEAIFPDLCRRFVRNGADFMVTITNDAWFGKTSAPYQHLAQATFRSIENRIWLVRVANTGISAFVDPWGRIKTASGLFSREILTEEVGLQGSTMTFYARYGDVFALFCSLLGICLIGYGVFRNQMVW